MITTIQSTIKESLYYGTCKISVLRSITFVLVSDGRIHKLHLCIGFLTMKKASIAVAVVLVVGALAVAFSLAATTTTASFAQNVTSPTTNATGTTLGKEIYHETGHTVVDRVIAVSNTEATLESTYTDKGTFNGTTSVTDIGSIVNTINNMGEMSGKGQGLFRTSDGSMAAYKESWTGSQDIHGNSNLQGTMNFTSLATGKLASLHSATLVFKLQINPAGNSELRASELK